MRAAALAEYTTAGALAGAAFTGLGATLLHPASPDGFDRRAATVAGLIGGAITHAALGALAAIEGHRPISHRLIDVGASLPLAALTAGVLGGAILNAAGREHVPAPGALVLSGLIGAAVISCAATAATCAALITCQPHPRWTRLVHGDLGRGEALEDDLKGQTEASEGHGRARAEAEHPRRGLAERLLPFERHHDAA